MKNTYQDIISIIASNFPQNEHCRVCIELRKTAGRTIDTFYCEII